MHLKKLYDELHEKYFNNKFADYDVTVNWSNRLTACAGNCRSNKWEKTAKINLSTHYHEKYPEDVAKTLLHEMIHIHAKGHGQYFQSEMQRIRRLGGEVYRYSKERATEKNIKWEYICSNCGIKNPRARKLDVNKYICRRCRSKLIEKRVGNE